jgi:hypothetical protein
MAIIRFMLGGKIRLMGNKKHELKKPVSVYIPLICLFKGRILSQ